MNAKLLEERLKSLVELARESGKRTVFTISTTSKVDVSGFYLTPIRKFSNLLVSGVVVYSSDIAKLAASRADGLIDYIFVDAEKKIIGESESNSVVNIETDVKRLVNESCCISYKANDMSVDAADSFVAEIFRRDEVGLGRKKVALIGLGNIGFKMALKLVERGAFVHCYRRDQTKLNLMVDSINLVKPRYTLASAVAESSVIAACKSADIVLGVTNGIGAITREHLTVIAEGAFVMDIGKGSFSSDASEFLLERKIPEYRLSIEHIFEGFLEAQISLESRYMAKVGRSVINGVALVSGGLSAYDGEVVVDDFRNPKVLYGVGNGRGDFRDLDPQKNQSIKRILNIT